MEMSRSVFIRNSSVSLSLTLIRNEKVEHYIRIMTYKPIVVLSWEWCQCLIWLSSSLISWMHWLNALWSLKGRLLALLGLT